MPEIKVTVSKGSTVISDQSNEVPSNSLSDLIAALKSTKEQTNAVLTKLVDESKETKQARRLSEADDDDDESGEDEDEGRVTKKPNIE